MCHCQPRRWYTLRRFYKTINQAGSILMDERNKGKPQDGTQNSSSHRRMFREHCTQAEGPFSHSVPVGLHLLLRTSLLNHYSHTDPFYVKQEFAPSDKEGNLKRKHQAYNLIAPHFRLIQFLSSNFNATRLSSPHIEKIYHRLMLTTLNNMDATTNHPLAREVHFHVVLLALRILCHSTSLGSRDKWRLKDLILSAGLTWFARNPKWTYGGNRLQVKAEAHVLADVQAFLQQIAQVGAKTEGSLKSLQGKQELLSLLIASEQTRLMVWLFPLDSEKKHHLSFGHHSHKLAEVRQLS